MDTVVPGKKRLGCSLVGGLPRTDLHRINVTPMKKGAIACCPGESPVQAAAARQTLPQRQMRMFYVRISAVGGHLAPPERQEDATWMRTHFRAGERNASKVNSREPCFGTDATTGCVSCFNCLSFCFRH